MKNLLLSKQKIIVAFGDTKTLSDLYGITRQAIYQWPDVVTGKTASHLLFLANQHGIDISIAIIHGDTQPETGNGG